MKRFHCYPIAKFVEVAELISDGSYWPNPRIDGVNN